MATITKSNFGSYRAQFRRIEQPLIYKLLKTKAKAEEWCYRIEYELKTGLHINRTEAERITLAELIDRYLSEVSV